MAAIGPLTNIATATLDQRLRVAIDEHDVDRVAAAHPIGPLMADQARRFWRWLSGRRSGLPGDRSWAHDPLTLLALVEPYWFTLTTIAVEANPDGPLRGTKDQRSVIEVVTDLDVAGAHDAILGLLGYA